MRKLYKVLRDDLTSPFKGFNYELGKWYTCENFDSRDIECSHGFYATDIEGVTYSLRKGMSVFEVMVDGRYKEFGVYKRRYEKQKVVRKLSESEVRELARSSNCGYDLEKAIYPHNPFCNAPTINHSKALELLSEWDSVRDSVLDSQYAYISYNFYYNKNYKYNKLI